MEPVIHRLGYHISSGSRFHVQSPHLASLPRKTAAWEDFDNANKRNASKPSEVQPYLGNVVTLSEFSPRGQVMKHLISAWILDERPDHRSLEEAGADCIYVDVVRRVLRKETIFRS